MPSSHATAARYQLPSRVVDESGNPIPQIFVLQAQDDSIAVSMVNLQGLGVAVTNQNFFGTIVAEISFDGQNWTPTAFFNLITGYVHYRGRTYGDGPPANPEYLGVIIQGGTIQARIRISGYGVGSLQVAINATVAPIIPPTRPLGGTPFTLNLTGSFTPSATTATQPPDPVLQMCARKFPGAANGMYIDNITIMNVGAALNTGNLYGRLVRRKPVLYNNAGAAPAAPAAPTLAAFAFVGAIIGGTGTYRVKYVAVDSAGMEGNYSPASLGVAPAVNQGLRVTMAALPAGAHGYNVYLEDPVNLNFVFVGRAVTTTFEILFPASASAHNWVEATLQTWGNTMITSIDNPGYAEGNHELIFEVYRALASAPIRLELSDPLTGGFRHFCITIAPATTLGTRYRIPMFDEAHGITAGAAGMLFRDADYTYGLAGRAMLSPQNMAGEDDFGFQPANFDKAYATIGGAWCLWREEVFGLTHIVSASKTWYDTVAGATGSAQAAPTSGTLLQMQFLKPPVFDINDEVILEIGAGATPAAFTLAVAVNGRYF